MKKNILVVGFFILSFECITVLNVIANHPNIDTENVILPLDKSMAGTYSKSGAAGSIRSLKIHEDKTFDVTYSTHDGGWLEAHGSMTVLKDKLKLTTKSIKKNRSFEIDDISVLVPIKWGKRLYVIPESKLALFCNEVNLGTEPRDGAIGRFLLHERDCLSKPSKDPDLPRPWQDFLVKEPIKGKVLSIDSSSGTINLGKDDKIFKNMLLYIMPDKKNTELIKSKNYIYTQFTGLAVVTNVYDKTCAFEVYKFQKFKNIKFFQENYLVVSRFPQDVLEEPFYLYFLWE